MSKRTRNSQLQIELDKSVPTSIGLEPGRGRALVADGIDPIALVSLDFRGRPFCRSVLSTCAENRRGRIGKPGQFLEDGNFYLPL
jgi:hypothetical protein